MAATAAPERGPGLRKVTTALAPLDLMEARRFGRCGGRPCRLCGGGRPFSSRALATRAALMAAITATPENGSGPRQSEGDDCPRASEAEGGGHFGRRRGPPPP